MLKQIAILFLMCIHFAASDDNSTAYPSMEEKCHKAKDRAELTTTIALSAVLAFSVILFGVTIFVFTSSYKLFHGASATEKEVYAIMDHILRRLCNQKVCDEIYWRASCVQLRQNAKHQRHQLRASGIQSDSPQK
ncbi:hypothetical protein M3Y97_00221800 [Aphelenchoides bicaudatus]|nr:hypothetical protein M3Y97_00221800 [Aphelenchoides bicaudatus]